MLARLVLVVAIGLTCSAAAETCATFQGATGHPLQTRRPVLGDDVRLTSGFGLKFHPLLQQEKMHPGVDWAAATGTPVIAAGPGVISEANHKGYYGKMIVIDHGGGWQTLYAHLTDFAAQAGDCVASGAVIGHVGATGLTSGPALHFEVHRDTQPIDPMSVEIGGGDQPADRQ